MAEWEPGRRRAERALELPYPDVPDHLLHPLIDWLSAAIYDRERLARLCIDFRYRAPASSVGSWLKDRAVQDRTLLLDYAEWLLHLEALHPDEIDVLSDLLEQAHSKYKVAERPEDGLEERIDPTVTEQMRQIVAEVSGSAGDHLVGAWNEAYGRTPDPSKSYGESIKAVEAAVIPVVQPNNAKATLGTVLGELRANPALWSFVITPGTDEAVTDIIGIMGRLWAGQTSRHGGTGPTRLETEEEARAAVHLAATIVQLFSSGAFFRRS